MRLQRVETDETHPDTPLPVALDGSPVRWALFVDGCEMFTFPACEHADALHAQRVAMDSGRYEFVDLVIRPERRTEVRTMAEVVA